MKSTGGILRALILFAALFCVGCASAIQDDPSLVRYEWVSASRAREIMQERDRKVERLSAVCDVLLDDGRGKRVRLEGVIAIGEAGRARMQAWKMGRTVMDVVVEHDAVWIKQAEQETRDSREVLDRAGAAHAVKMGLSMLSGRMIAEQDARVIDDGGSTFQVIHLASAATDRGLKVTATIDRATLTARQYDIEDESGAPACQLKLSGFRVISGRESAMATRIEAIQGEARVVVDLREIDVNGELETGAFDVPAGAVKMR